MTEWTKKKILLLYLGAALTALVSTLIVWTLLLIARTVLTDHDRMNQVWSLELQRAQQAQQQQQQKAPPLPAPQAPSK